MLDRVRSYDFEEAVRKQKKYNNKAEKIYKSINLKKEMNKKISETLNKKNQIKKEMQEEHLRSTQEKLRTHLQTLALNLEKRPFKSEMKSDETLGKNKKFLQELQKLNMELQQENTLRIKRMREYKRKQILEADQEIKQKNKEKKTAFQLYDCYMRKQAVIDSKGKEGTTVLLNKLKKANPIHKEQRSELVQLLHSLNNKYDIGLKMALNPPRTTNDKVETDANKDSNLNLT